MVGANRMLNILVSIRDDESHQDPAAEEEIAAAIN
jgi:hypothetical protein